MKEPLRPLEGCLVNLSLSASPDLARRGFVPRDVDRALLALAESLLGAGARLLFGHDWRPGGIMETIAALAVAYQPVAGKGQPGDPLILNRLAPPDRPFLAPAPAKGEKDEPSDHDHAEHFEAKLRVALRGLVDARTIAWEPTPGEAEAVARANALSAQRRELTKMCEARVCVGGPVEGYQGWFGGIVEEAYLAQAAGKPLYVSGLFGGAAAQVVDAIRRGDGPTVAARKIDGDGPRPEPLIFSRGLPPNGLSPGQNALLFNAQSIDACVETTLGGLICWWNKGERGLQA